MLSDKGRIPSKGGRSSQGLEAGTQNWDCVTSVAFSWSKIVTGQFRFKEWRKQLHLLMGGQIHTAEFVDTRRNRILHIFIIQHTG